MIAQASVTSTVVPFPGRRKTHPALAHAIAIREALLPLRAILAREPDRLQFYGRWLLAGLDMLIETLVADSAVK